MTDRIVFKGHVNKIEPGGEDEDDMIFLSGKILRKERGGSPYAYQPPNYSEDEGDEDADRPAPISMYDRRKKKTRHKKVLRKRLKKRKRVKVKRLHKKKIKRPYRKKKTKRVKRKRLVKRKRKKVGR